MATEKKVSKTKHKSKKTRNRSRSKDRSTKEKHNHKRWHHSKSRSRKDDGSRHTEKDVNSRQDSPSKIEQIDDEEIMKKMMGFTSFDTTKQKKVIGNVDTFVLQKKARKYRQYMNRPGGFNKPLDPSA
ncbi:hypothetical protein HZS_6110 [Henneguya salminicola]|nr:hypothetical protein HZS_6110 [Henneguya salminicola]